MSSEPQQVFVRNHKGKLWGPVSLQTLELLLENQLIDGRIQVSKDGVNFAFPGRFPDIREFVPQALWGEGAPPPGAAPAAANAAPAVMTELGGAPSTVPAAGPGAVPMAGPGAAPMAGPGARQASAVRAGPGAVHASQQRSSPSQMRGTAPAAPPVVAPTPAPAPAASAPIAPPVAPPVAAAAPRPAAPPPPPAADLSGSLPARGELSAHSPVRLYYLAASGNHTGQLTFRLSDRVIDVHFRKGNPEHVSSDHADDALGGFLLRERLATADQLATAEQALPQFGGDLTAALFGTGVLNPGNAFTHLAQRAQALLMKALLADSGTFEWQLKDLPPHKAMPLGNRWGVLMEIVRRVPMPEIRRRLADVVDNPVMKSGGEVALADLRLTPHETRAMGFIDGVRSLNLLARDMRQDADLFFRLSWALRDMDIVSFAAAKLPPPQAKEAGTPAPPAAAAKPAAAAPAAAQAPATPKPAPTAAPRSPPPAAKAAPARPASAPPPVAPAAKTGPAAEPAAPVDYNAELVTLRALFAKLKDQNHFEVLGLKENTDSGQVKIAYFKMAKLYHPDTVPGDAPAELAKLKADIFAAVGEAYRTLSDDASRANYLEELKAGGGGDVDVLAILHAEELFQKGCILVKAKKFPEAVEMLTDAINTNADEGEFYAWRGIARFFTNKDKKAGAQEADRDMQQALKKNPRCAQAYFFQGQIAKLCGDHKAALAHFKKTLDMQPDHLDAQREIRYLKK